MAVALDFRGDKRKRYWFRPLHAQIRYGACAIAEQIGRVIAARMIALSMFQHLTERSEGCGFERLKLQDKAHGGPASTIAATGPLPWGPECIASTEMKTAGSPIAAVTAPPTAALA